MRTDNMVERKGARFVAFHFKHVEMNPTNQFRYKCIVATKTFMYNTVRQ
jgi:hypothetical protein